MGEGTLVLASQSPRRRELFSSVSDDFICVTSPADESGISALKAESLALERARAKCMAAAPSYPESFVIGCDTVVETLQGEILGKPANRDEAREMLQKLSGKEHRVHTAVVIAHNTLEAASFVCQTAVWFSELSVAEIESYISTDEPYDKAGGYGVQGLASKYIERIDGDFFNVVGLPVSRLYRELKQLGAL